MNDPLRVMFAIMFPILLVAELVLVVAVWRVGQGRLPTVVVRHGPIDRRGRVLNDVWLFSIWLLVSGTLVGLGLSAAFVAVHALLFTFGGGVAMAGLIVSLLAALAVPVVLGLLLWRHVRQS
jgi:hypothetical protein